ncbi:MAG: glycosyl transferase family 1 [Herpetosiphonaceae bacterium]|nr:MAG: glycosyl transferase family 1 [Herpetosiphonaceae bacterium]
MRITYLIGRYGGGAMSNRPHMELIAAWRRMGVDVTVLSLAAGDDPAGTALVEGVPVQRLPIDGRLPDLVLKPLGSLLFLYRYFLTLLPRYALAIPQHKPDLLHVEAAYPHGVIAALAAPATPLALTLQGADVMSEPAYDYGYGRFARVRRMLRWVFDRALLVRGDSEQIRDLAVSLGCDPAKAVGIPYNITWSSYLPADIDPAAFRAACRRAVAERHNLDPAVPLILSLGRLHPFKGVEYLVRAAPQILQAVPQARMLIAGPSRTTPRFGDYGAYLRRLAVDLGVEQAIIFAGPVPHDHVQRYFAAADLLVIPSVVEAFNRVLVEAAAVGTPAVVTATTGVSDYAGQAGCALVIPAEDAQALAAAAIRVLEDTALRGDMGRRAIDFAQDFSPERIGRRLLELYERALTARR